MKWLFNTINQVYYWYLKNKSDNVSVKKIGDLGMWWLNFKTNLFVGSLSDSETIYLGTTYNLFWQELAFYKACTYLEMKKLFTRKEYEVLQKLIIEGVSKEDVDKLALVKSDEVLNKFKEFCHSIYGNREKKTN